MVGPIAKPRKRAKAQPRFESAADFQAVVHEALSFLDTDSSRGPLFRASGMRIRFELPDIASTLDVAAAEGDAHYLRWMFEPTDWGPKLTLRMDSDVANGVFQGRESLAIGVARGRVKVSGEPRSTLTYVPALKLLVEPYRHAVRDLRPALVID